MTRKKITTLTFAQYKRQRQKIVCLTTYDYSMARWVDAAGVDLILVGDSLGNVMLGYEHTIPVTMDEMILHTRSVSRARQYAFVVGDMPFMSYQVSPEQALINAGRLMKEGLAEAVKLEGGRSVVPAVRKIVEAGIPVMGHLGLTPQSVHAMGGYRVQAKESHEAEQLLADALALEEAGAFAVVLECIPPDLAKTVTEKLSIPTIGIGAGPHCDGQILVFHDLLGFNAGKVPSFVKQYAQLGEAAQSAIAQYVQEVREVTFPS